MGNGWAWIYRKRGYSVTHCISDKMKIIQRLFQAFLIFCFMAVVCSAGWIVYFVLWLIAGLK